MREPALCEHGKQDFRTHGIATEPINRITCALADLDLHGRLDIVAGAMNVFPLIRGVAARAGRSVTERAWNFFARSGG